MIKSNDKVDQRLIDMIRVKYANQERISIGFNRFQMSDDEEIDDQLYLKDITDNDPRKEMFDHTFEKPFSDLLDLDNDSYTS